MPIKKKKKNWLSKAKDKMLRITNKKIIIK